MPSTAAAISPFPAPHVGTILVDSGFYSEAVVQAVGRKLEGTPSGVFLLAAAEKLSHHRTVADVLPQPSRPARGPEASANEKIAHWLKCASGKALYKLRKQTVEPVFGILKEVMGFGRFSLRGDAKVALEWNLVYMSYDLKRSWSLKTQASAA